MTENKLIEEKTTLIKGEEFENAITEAANVKKDILTSCRTRNKDNYMRFYDIVVMSRHDIQDILEMKGKSRTDQDKAKLKEFKKNTSLMYKQVCDLITEEELEEGEENKIQKLVKRVATVVKLMNYLGHTEIEEEFKKYGIELKYEKMDSEDVFSNDNIKNDVKSIFDMGKNIKEDINKNNTTIKDDIYDSAVPIDLQFDKQSNPTGITKSDFCKIVDLKTKLIMAADDEAKEKIEDKANSIAGDYEFTNVRNKLVQSKILELT